MSFRKRRNDSEGDSDEDRIPVANDDDDLEENGPSAAKKSRNMWSDMLVEQQLLEKGKGIDLEKGKKNQSTFYRGPESYVMPSDAFQAKKNEEKAHGDQEKATSSEPAPPKFEKPVVVITPANDDPFGDAPIAPAENFGVKAYDRHEQLVKSEQRKGWWSSGPGHAKNQRAMAGREKSPNDEERDYRRHAPKTSQLISAKYSLEEFLACELDKESLDLDKLAMDIAQAMGEKDPDTVKKIVTEVGSELSIRLFEETKEIEKNGGMKTHDGSRRRTPGGVFITLFKMDPNVSKEQKNSIFGDMRQLDKNRSRSRKRARNFVKKLEDVKRTMDEAANPQEEEEEQVEPPIEQKSVSMFDDEVCDMV